jgi:hypothetical protein
MTGDALTLIITRMTEARTPPSDMPPPPRWLVWLTAVSVSLAVLSLLALLWGRWGLVASMTSTLMRYCF